MASYLATGCSRGLELALVARLATLPKTEVGTILATARQDHSPQLTEIASTSSGRLQIVKLHVTDESSVKEAVAVVERQLQVKGLDYLVNNAGVSDWSPTGLEGMDNLNEMFNINATGTHLVSRLPATSVQRRQESNNQHVRTAGGN
ncbi:hypothetical protein PENCOP_c001G08920 [Penicillium coprophilum]|uniref:Ketoreductase (KR) domain-containing protein n=1 Tax=Penicillium coprophilum TaxID=36646 RepID=A0A1V6V7S9_9EURO|nr:hypothetical protein PENCOP_c001G08920 [Penicillium coprophilum]